MEKFQLYSIPTDLNAFQNNLLDKSVHEMNWFKVY